MSVIVKVGKGVLAHVSAIGAWPVLTCTNKAHADHEKITFSARRTCPEVMSRSAFGRLTISSFIQLIS
jgi:hypothetical protein